MSRTSVDDVVAATRAVHHYKGKYIKQTLDRLEMLDALTPEVRKVVLDSFNEYARTVLIQLGYTIEQ